MAQKGSLSLSASVISYKGAKMDVVPEIVLLDGQDAVEVDGTTVTAKKAGQAHALLRATQVIDSGRRYDMYSQPITIEVAGDNGGDNGGNNGGDNGGNNGGDNGGDNGTPSTLPGHTSGGTAGSIQANDGKADADELKKSFAANNQVQVDFTGDTVVLPAAGLIDASRAGGKTLTVAGNRMAYTLPLSALKLDEWAQQFGGQVNDLNLRITVGRLAAGDAAAVSSAVTAAGGKLAAEAVKLGAEVSGKDGKAVAVGLENSKVSRVWTLDGILDPGKATVVRYDPQTGRLQFVPATFGTLGGQAIVTIKSGGDGVYAVVASNRSFADLPAGHWAKADIELLANKLVVNGVSENRFDADRSVTRAEFAALVARALGLASANANGVFGDVQDADWYADAVAAAAQAGILGGYEDGTFRPNREITREEMAAMLIRAMKYAGIDLNLSAAQRDEALAPFKDANATGWAKSELAAAVQTGLINGKTADMLEPNGVATRAQSAVMLKRLLTRASFIN
ncbi:S-layer homology domain-containing protein [Cohnella rhizosphaerae]|uniref:S-layer homology domain-containing protein n=1 Tax=Cohnella rhizosphaerae TaxID=1457232 RepID=A0A9X4KQZ1_9BACL|nr:S-layer homology domain-containing protein [Cohnella rhizosphaerae]MDG0809571.1 S-layer homology domain-containing protein [Cohnella rhizosphaerae]